MPSWWDISKGLKSLFEKRLGSVRMYYCRIFITHNYKKVWICLYNPLESLLLLSATPWIQFYFCLPTDSEFGSHSSWPSNNDENSIYLPGHFILQLTKNFQLIIYITPLRTRRGYHCYFALKMRRFTEDEKKLKRKKQHNVSQGWEQKEKLPRKL